MQIKIRFNFNKLFFWMALIITGILVIQGESVTNVLLGFIAVLMADYLGNFLDLSDFIYQFKLIEIPDVEEIMHE